MRAFAFNIFFARVVSTPLLLLFHRERKPLWRMSRNLRHARRTLFSSLFSLFSLHFLHKSWETTFSKLVGGEQTAISNIHEAKIFWASPNTHTRTPETSLLFLPPYTEVGDDVDASLSVGDPSRCLSRFEFSFCFFLHVVGWCPSYKGRFFIHFTVFGVQGFGGSGESRVSSFPLRTPCLYSITWSGVVDGVGVRECPMCVYLPSILTVDCISIYIFSFWVSFWLW